MRVGVATCTLTAPSHSSRRRPPFPSHSRRRPRWKWIQWSPRGQRPRRRSWRRRSRRATLHRLRQRPTSHRQHRPLSRPMHGPLPFRQANRRRLRPRQLRRRPNTKRAWNRAPRRLRLRRLRPPRRKGIPPLVRTGRHRTCPLLLIHYKATARNASFLRRFTKSDAKRRPSSVLLFAYTASAMISTTSGDGFRGKDRSMSKNSSTALETKTYHSLEDRATARGSTAKTRGWAAAAS